jgi:hypothetical protein
VSGVDPMVYELAAYFVNDVLLKLAQARGGLVNPDQREALTARTAQAMQQAIEDECEAIRQELGAPLVSTSYPERSE